MKQTDFNRLCRRLFKMKEDLPAEYRHQMLLHVVCERGPVHPGLVTPLLDHSWIHSMGYLYETKGWLHLGSHRIR